ncbi:MAG: glycosyltransferase family 2 protein [Cyanophyceae cyanobacterium]
MIYIILPVHNRRELTQGFVDCLLAQTETNYHLILVDDGSTDGTEEMVRNRVRSLTVIKGQGDWWWAGSLQQGINWLKNRAVPPSDLVLTINDDVTFGPDFLAKAAEILKHQPRTLLLAQAFSKQSGRLLTTGVHADLKRLTFDLSPASEEINCLPTRGLFVRSVDLMEIGNFYPRLLPHYLSDYEFTIRAHRRGLTLTTSSELKLWVNEATTGFFQSENGGFGKFIRQYFSNKSMNNPLHWTIFVILSCPKAWIPLNLVRVWKWSALTIVKQAVSFSPTPDSRSHLL